MESFIFSISFLGASAKPLKELAHMDKYGFQDYAFTKKISKPIQKIWNKNITLKLYWKYQVKQSSLSQPESGITWQARCNAIKFNIKRNIESGKAISELYLSMVVSIITDVSETYIKTATPDFEKTPSLILPTILFVESMFEEYNYILKCFERWSSACIFEETIEEFYLCNWG